MAVAECHDPDEKWGLVVEDQKEKWVVKRCGTEYGDSYSVTVAEFDTYEEAQEYVDTHDPDFIGDHFEIDKE